MATRIHPKNVHEKSPKNVHEMSPKVSTRCHLFCPRDVTYYIHEISATQCNVAKQSSQVIQHIHDVLSNLCLTIAAKIALLLNPNPI